MDFLLLAKILVAVIALSAFSWIVGASFREWRDSPSLWLRYGSIFVRYAVFLGVLWLIWNVPPDYVRVFASVSVPVVYFLAREYAKHES